MTCVIHCYAVLAIVSNSYPPLQGRLPTRYSPVRNSSKKSKLLSSAFYLHVLGTPPAFVLSQDQTLHKKISEQNSETGREKPETQQKNKPPQTTKACAGVQKITTKKKVPSTRRGQKEETTKLNTITCQPIHLNAAETPNSIQKGTYSTYPTGTHQPTNH